MLRADDASPFHAGERAAQTRVGVRAQLEPIGRRIIRGFMPDEHRELFCALPWMLIGSLDAHGRPWASVLAGRPGFVRSPDAHTLAIDARLAPGDPAAAHIVPGAPVGLLGLQPETRRRNRMNGRVIETTEGGFVVTVDQSFGNCPKYIQARAPEIVPDRIVGAARAEGCLLSATATRFVERADTFFIASASREAHRGGASEGVDVSHRGGKPGFTRVTEEGGQSVLTWPDFRGNFLFNTIGNVEARPQAGVSFLDFDTGDVLSVTGDAEVSWDEPTGFAGADRLMRLRVREGVWIERAVPLRWSAPVLSPSLSATGEW